MKLVLYKKQTPNYPHLPINSSYKNERLWRHTLLFICSHGDQWLSDRFAFCIKTHMGA